MRNIFIHRATVRVGCTRRRLRFVYVRVRPPFSKFIRILILLPGSTVVLGQGGKTPNMLEKSLFKKVVRRELELDFGAIDINEAAFKGKPEAFWEGPGQ